MNRRAYIAHYVFDPISDNDIETVLYEDSYWSDYLSNKWDIAVSQWKREDKPNTYIQAWYYDEVSTVEIGKTLRTPVLV